MSTPPAPAWRSYLMNDVRLEIPGGWDDQSVNIFALLPPGRVAGDELPPGAAPVPEFSFVVHRDAPREDESAAEYVERQIMQLQGTLPGLTVVRRGELLVGGVAALDAEFRWAADQGLLHQRQVYVPRRGRVLTFTATAPARVWFRHAETVEQVLGGLRFVTPIVGLPPRPLGAAPPGQAPADPPGEA